MPLDKWLYAIYLLMTARKGISSLQLSKEIGVTQKTAWFMLQRLREACGNDKNDDDSNGGGFSFLKGIVEVDETYIGSKEMNKHESKKLKAGRGTIGKAIVIGMRERGGHVKTAILGSTSAASIQGAVRYAVAAETLLCTDKHSSYVGMSEYSHRVVNHTAKQYVDGMAHNNGI